MQTTMTVKGQVTIPKPVRDAAGMAPGGRVEVTNGPDGEVIVRPVDPNDAAWREQRRAYLTRVLDEVSGSIDLGMTTDEYMATIREPVP